MDVISFVHIILTLYAALGAIAITSQSNPLKPSGTISSKVRGQIDISKPIIFQGYLEESYSTEQKKSILNFNVSYSGAPSRISGKYYHDTVGGIVAYEAEGSCKSMDKNEFLSTLVGLKQIDLGDQDLNKWLSGPVMRIVSFIEQQDLSRSLKKTNEGFEREWIDNHNELKYSLLYLVDVAEKIVINSIPSKIVISRSDNLKLIFEVSQLRTIEDPPSNGLNIQFDYFTIPLKSQILNCLEDDMRMIDSFWPKDLKSIHEEKFSFKYKARRDQIKLRKDFTGEVIFDSLLGSLYIERFWENNQRLEKQIINFHQNLRYYQTRVVKNMKGITIPYADDIEHLSSQTNLLITTLPETLSVDPNEIGSTITMDRIIFGGNKFIYLGRAVVEGFEAKMYYAKQASLPIWVQSTFSFKSDDKRENNYQIVVFVASHDTDTIQNQGHILYMKFFSRRVSYTVRLYDFSLSVNHDPVSEVFSLAENFREDIHIHDYKSSRLNKIDLEIDMELELSLDHQLRLKDDIFFSAQERDRSLIGALQKSHGWPVNVLNDIRTKDVFKQHGTNNLILLASLVASFSDPSRITRLEHIVNANRYKRVAWSFVSVTRYCSLDGCAAIASSMIGLESIIIGYNWLDEECYIVRASRGLIDVDPEQLGFSVNSTGPIWIIKVQKMNDLNIRERFSKRNLLMNKPLELEGLASEPLVFKVKQFNARIIGTDKPIEQLGSDPNQRGPFTFKGYGLIADGKLNIEITSSNLSSIRFGSDVKSNEQNLASEDESNKFLVRVSREECLSVCMTHIECGSYSICLSSKGQECVISKLNFLSPELSKKLTENSLIRKEIPIETSDGEGNKHVTRLINYLNCELNNKQYLDLYMPMRLLSPIDRGYVNAALEISSENSIRGRDMCAEICFRLNLKYLEEDIKERQAIIGDHKSAKDWLNKNSNKMHKTCAKFIYQVNDKNTGYCFFEGAQPDQPMVQVDSKDRIIISEVYGFKFESFYQRHSGIMLNRSSNVDPATYIAYSLAKKNPNNLTEQQFTSLKSYLENGGTFRQLHYGFSESDCARLCFEQSGQVWPACRSFSITILSNTEKPLCTLFTTTLQQVTTLKGAYTPQIIEARGEKASSMVNHFEPIAGLMLQDAFLAGEIEIEKDQETIQVSKMKKSEAHGLHVVLVTICIVSVAIASGGFIAMKMANLFMYRSAPRIPTINIDAVSRGTWAGNDSETVGMNIIT